MSEPRYGLHALVDDATAVIARLATGRNRFFARSLDSPPLPAVVRDTDVSAPPVTGLGVQEAEAATPIGTLEPAFRVARWHGPHQPSLVYLQGSGERPFDDSVTSKNSFKIIVLDASPEWAANLIVVRAPFHSGSQRDYALAMGDLANFTAMLASMVGLTEHIVASLADSGGRTIVTGVSLGGWVTNLHAALCGSADTYVPVMAGAALDDLFLHSTYRWLTGRMARERPDRISSVLNFEDVFRSAPRERVFPLLGRHDRYIRWDRQSRSYGPVAARSMERGHVTAMASPGPIQAHLREHVPVQEVKGVRP